MLAVSHTKPLHDAVAQMADDLYGGFAPKQGCFGCLPKVLHDAKPAEQATLDTPFFIAKSFFDRLLIYLLYNGIVSGIVRGLLEDCFAKMKNA